MDLLFAADTPWNWDAEATFARLKKDMPQIAHGVAGAQAVEEALAKEGGKGSQSFRS